MEDCYWKLLEIKYANKNCIETKHQLIMSWETNSMFHFFGAPLKMFYVKHADFIVVVKVRPHICFDPMSIKSKTYFIIFIFFTTFFPMTELCIALFGI